MDSYTSVSAEGVTNVTANHELNALGQNLTTVLVRPFFIGNSVSTLLRVSHQVLGTPDVRLTAKQKWLVGSALSNLASIRHKYVPETGASVAKKEAESKARQALMAGYFAKRRKA